ncbi:cryptochrome/photolyase family protein [Rheinheimera sp. WS51]|uniref:cryptochrome/photolyase family protein n=1 Tax=Rheinheimera sp. WS51 TaxID=3425886 RepID=UPI003D8A9E16
MTVLYKNLRLILGDQLNAQHSWFKQKCPNTLYVMAELQQETNYVVHHVQKICAFFAAMSHFATALNAAGHKVLYLTLDDTKAYSDLPHLLGHLFTTYKIEKFEYQLPDEYRLRKQLNEFCQRNTIANLSCSSEHFYLTEQDLAKQFVPGKRHTMEAFYRKMRIKFNILIADNTPEGGQWNYDANNRNKLKNCDIANIPEPLLFANDVSDIIARLNQHNIKTLGKTDSQLLWPINRQQAKQLLDFFCRYCLAQFGQFQDAMTAQQDILTQDKQWSLYHSRLSFALNSKMLSPQLVINTALGYYQKQDNISLYQIEGFIRQILGWREFVRGVYWANMPNYATLNTLAATRELPSWFWTANTKMRCLQQAISQSLDYAYAHHIQRLMVTGNFCLLTGIHPDQVDKWYLGIYIDAIEWVELPNTRGMSQFADGGIVGSKAYAASGNYIKKMSDYCVNCHYKVAKITESDACPLNALYWNFMQKHQTDFNSNPRNSMVYANWNKKTAQQQQAILDHAENSIKNIEQL